MCQGALTGITTACPRSQEKANVVAEVLETTGRFAREAQSPAGVRDPVEIRRAACARLDALGGVGVRALAFPRASGVPE